jgi:plasmid stabilization system protein ParE
MGRVAWLRQPATGPASLSLRWSPRSLVDVRRLHDFLAEVNPDAAARRVEMLLRAPEHLLQFPRLGARLEQFRPREVRRIFVGDYELRHEVIDGDITVLQLWHGREDR